MNVKLILYLDKNVRYFIFHIFSCFFLLRDFFQSSFDEMIKPETFSCLFVFHHQICKPVHVT